ncbi:MAG: hypothetical protein ACO26M_07060 [Limnohabitans sp.]
MIAAPSVILSHALPPADSPEMLEALTALPVPFVRQWLGESVRQHTLTTSAEDLVLPAEWARAETLGWTSPHGTWPWAALGALLAPAPHAASQSAWAFIRLCHWQVGNGQFTLLDPGSITQEESDALMASMRTYFEEDGITLQAHEPGRWLAQSSLFDGLASASAERVMGLPIEPWLLGAHLPSLSPAIRTLRRLQNEMQMLLYQHPVNDARRTPINSIWIEGCGQLGGDCPAPMPNAASAILLDDLREPWLLRDAAAWARAWQRLDAEVLPPLLSPAGARIAWCGPRQARWWIHQPPSVWQRLQRVLRPVQLNEVLSCDV